MNIAFIGGGNMASALIGGLLKKGWSATGITVAEIDAAARERLAREFHVQAHEDLAPALDGADAIVLAVKPQQLQGVARAFAPLLRGRLVITIAAGIRCADLARWLNGHARIVRAMPNTPALVLAGVTGLYAASGASDDDRRRAEQILGVAGITLWLTAEEQIDGLTAVSGSGPAYVFYFIDALQRAALELGFSDADARMLAVETFGGAVKLARESSDSVAMLRERVTSKGGTTERAIAELEGARVREAIVRAVLAAAVRSRELGDVLGRDETNTRPI